MFSEVRFSSANDADENRHHLATVTIVLSSGGGLNVGIPLKSVQSARALSTHSGVCILTVLGIFILRGALNT